MREQNSVDPMGIHWEAFPIAQAQRLEALEQTAIDQQSMIGIFDKIFRTGNSPGPTQKGQSQTQG